MILAGDVGGTKCNLAVYSFSGNKPESCFENSYPSEDFPGLEGVISSFVEEFEKVFPHKSRAIRAACIGIAGPVVSQKVDTTNLPWVISAEGLREVLGIRHVLLINDLEATGYGVLNLDDSEFLTLNQGQPDNSGQAALIAAGTGLGETIFVRRDGQLYPLPSEGGHSSFSPCSRLEMDLLEYLLDRYDHVSTERVLSGPGLYNIYRFLRDTGIEKEPSGLGESLAGAGDPSAFISGKALEGEFPIAVRALELFVSVYGSEAANLALKANSTSGVYIGGGIAPKILPFLVKELFIKAFLAKGRMRGFLESMPVRVALNPKAALLGAACCGERLLQAKPPFLTG